VDEVIERVMFDPTATERLIVPEEAARLALSLASDLARLVTGASVPMDLGWTVL